MKLGGWGEHGSFEQVLHEITNSRDNIFLILSLPIYGCSSPQRYCSAMTLEGALFAPSSIIVPKIEWYKEGALFVPSYVIVPNIK